MECRIFSFNGALLYRKFSLLWNNNGITIPVNYFIDPYYKNVPTAISAPDRKTVSATFQSPANEEQWLPITTTEGCNFVGGWNRKIVGGRSRETSLSSLTEGASRRGWLRKTWMWKGGSRMSRASRQLHRPPCVCAPVCAGREVKSRAVQALVAKSRHWYYYFLARSI